MDQHRDQNHDPGADPRHARDLDPDTAALLASIRESIIGDDRLLDGPYGPRRLTYADYTASGRSLRFIEDYLQREVLPLYANTHTETSRTGLQTTRFREEAREIIHRACGGGPDDVVIFCGAGATGAICKLIDAMNLRLPADLAARYDLLDRIPAADRPVVFIGPYEHHSNELPWRESIADVVTIAEDSDGRIDAAHLRRELARYADRPLKIGSFSAASNVTGIVSDTYALTRLLHEHGALAFWDFAAAGPYVKIEMNPPAGAGAPAAADAGLRAAPTPPDAGPATADAGPDAAHAAHAADAALVAKDAVFLSPHKFIGGPGTPGVLVVKRALLRNRVPTVPGGGTVSYVSATGHEYLADPIHREEGGTPAIIEGIRAGLVLQLKERIGAATIERLEHGFVSRAIASWSANPHLEILGNRTAQRLSIVSFVVRHGQKLLHHNYVVALLNDLFGIQARGGCSCAGPYGHRLLGIDIADSERFREAIHEGHEGIKPGWVRVNFNYFIDEATFQYILEAVHLVARDGWRLLPDYEFEAATGLWRHRDHRLTPTSSLADLRYDGGIPVLPGAHPTAPVSALAGYLAEAQAILAAAARPGAAPSEPGAPPSNASPDGTPQTSTPRGSTPPESTADLPTRLAGAEDERLRWFTLPGEVVAGGTEPAGS